MMTWAEDRAPWRHDPSADPGAKTEGGRHDAALSFPFGIGTKAANRPHLFPCALYLISQPRFLHFTLNHYNFTGTFSRMMVLIVNFSSTDYFFMHCANSARGEGAIAEVVRNRTLRKSVTCLPTSFNCFRSSWMSSSPLHRLTALSPPGRLAGPRDTARSPGRICGAIPPTSRALCLAPRQKPP